MLKAKEIQNRITSIQATQQITKALKMIATTRLRKVKKKITTLLPYTREFIQIFENIAFTAHKSLPTPPLLQPNPTQSMLLVFFTTNKGFCGGLNKQVCQQTNHLYQQYTAQNKKIKLLPIGKKGALFLKKHQLPYINKYLDLGKNPCLSQTQSLGAFLLDSYKKNTYDRITLIYQANTNALEQSVKIQQLLPIKPITSPIQRQKLDYIHEPSKDTIIDDMTPNIITLNLFQALLKAIEAEHTARNNAMSKATDNADALLKELRRAYNRTRQTAITKQIIEIAASAEALKHS